MKKASVVARSFLIVFIILMFHPRAARAVPLTVTFDTVSIGCNSPPASYSELGMTVTSGDHVHVCENDPGQTQSLRNHLGNNVHPYRFEYLSGSPFDLLSFDIGIRVGWNPGKSTFTSSNGGSTTIDTLGTFTFLGSEWRNLTWLQWDQGTKNTFRTNNTVMDNLVFQPSITATPEPSTFILLASGLFGLLGWKYRLKKK